MKIKLAITLIGLSSLLNANYSTDDVILKLVKDVQKLEVSEKNLLAAFKKSELKIQKLEQELNTIKISQSQLQTPIKETKPIVSIKAGKNAIVNTRVLRVREKASINSKLISTYFIGDEIKNIHESGGWLQTDKGFIKMSYTKIFEPEEIISLTSKKDNINVRSTPFFGNNVIKTIPLGKEIKAYPTLFNKHWYRLYGANGFVHESMMKRD